MSKTEDAFRTISEVAAELDVQKHVLRFWEGKFPQIRPMKRGGGRRYYRPEDLALLRGINRLLHNEGYTIKGVQKILREQGVEFVKQAATGSAVQAPPGEAVKKRGRGARGGAPLSLAPAAASPKAPSGATLRAQIKQAISELEIGRSILQDRAIETSARGRTASAKSRRSPRP
jgi:DNA-binding transcriptional MerR regulator